MRFAIMQPCACDCFAKLQYAKYKSNSLGNPTCELSKRDTIGEELPCVITESGTFTIIKSLALIKKKSVIPEQWE
jgi:hypothetical protein